MNVSRDAWRFGPFRLEADAFRLLREGTPVDLSPKALDLLLLLVSRNGALVEKDEIISVLWRDVAITDNSLTQLVSEVRRALGDSARSPSFIQTVPRRGYRFVADVATEPAAGDEAPAPVSSQDPGTGAPRAVAVLEFLNVTGDDEVAWLGVGVPETIASDLRSLRALRVVDRALLARASDVASAAEALRATQTEIVVVGSVQRAAERLRITARAIVLSSGETLAHAKADGRMEAVFDLQDAIVQQLVAGLRVKVTGATVTRGGTRETASLDAYRAVTEGRLLLETLDPRDVPGAIACFERALDHDATYAVAHVGLAHAGFWRYQATRSRSTPSTEELEAAIRHAERAGELEPDLAEAHAALAFILPSAGRGTEALAAGRRAVELEPGNWRHQFRLGIAAWGGERVGTLEEVVSQFPQLAYAAFALAMVHVARGHLERAAEVLVAGINASGSAPAVPTRFPPSGLHWLLGLIRLARSEYGAAESEFRRELTRPGRGMLAGEYAAATHRALGFLRLQLDDPSGALSEFRAELDRRPADPISQLGAAGALSALGREAEAEEARRAASRLVEVLREHGRAVDAALADACAQAMGRKSGGAHRILARMLSQAPPGPAGWSIPVEPWLAGLRREPAGTAVLRLLASRAR